MQRLVAVLLGHPEMHALHFLMRDIELLSPCAMGRDLRGLCAKDSFFFEVLSDLAATRTRCLNVFGGIAFDFGLAAGSPLNFVSQGFQPQGQLGTIYSCRVLLGAIQLPGLERAGLSIPTLGYIEKDNMGVQLRRGITIHRAAAVMLKFGGCPFAGGFHVVA